MSLTVVMATVFPVVSASASPVSPTDCSHSFVYTWPHNVGGSTEQYAWVATYNFSPGQNGYSPSTGWVSCDSLEHSTYLYWRTVAGPSYFYAGSAHAYSGGYAGVVYRRNCGVSSRCMWLKSYHVEQHAIFDTEYF